jgi:EpsI family protein
MAVTIAAAGLTAGWPEAAARLEAAGANGLPALQALPSAENWQPVAGRLTDWTPRFLSPSAQFHQTYGKEGTRAGLYIGYYRNQRQGAELITSLNRLVPGNDRVWTNTGETSRTLVFNQEEISASEAKLLGRSKRLLVWRWYWVDGRYIVNPYWAKLLQAKSMLLGRGDDGAVVIVYAAYDDRPQAAEQALKAFVGAMLPAITRSLEYARGTLPAALAPSRPPHSRSSRRESPRY